MKRLFIALILLCGLSLPSFSQKGDTVKVTSSVVKTSFLKPGVNRYLVYFKKGKDSSRVNYQMWTRTVDVVDFKGKNAISITQEWEDNSSVVHKVKSISDAKTFAPLFHDTWWRGRGSASFDFLDNKVLYNGKSLTAADTAKGTKTVYDAFQAALAEKNVLNWHLDLEVFPILPYKSGRTFLINFYDPGFGAPKYQEYTVTGNDVLKGYNNEEVDCWLLSHTSPGNTETFWVSKKTQEVLKLEQEFRGQYRYKIKLGFSI